MWWDLKKVVHEHIPKNLTELKQCYNKEWTRVPVRDSWTHSVSDYLKLLLVKVNIRLRLFLMAWLKKVVGHLLLYLPHRLTSVW